MEIVVIGAGSLGTLIGGLLARKHAVTLVGRDPHMAAIQKNGLNITGAIDEQTDPQAVTDATGADAALAVVTVKTYDTASAIEVIKSGSYQAVLSLQNGLTEEQLAAAIDAEVLAGTVTYGAQHTEPGRVTCTGIGEVVLGAHGGGKSSHADRAGDAFDQCGINTIVGTDMPTRRWKKVAVNAGINPVTALARAKNGALQSEPLRTIAQQATKESARTARQSGVPLSNREAIAELERVVTATAVNRSSMLQDVDAGKRTEIDAICGVVRERADRYGVDVPTTKTLLGLIRGWEKENEVRESIDD